MANAPFRTVLRHLRQLGDAAALHEDTDAQLLEAFQRRRDEAAFAALARRHGPMVLGVGRRLLGREQDAEDVYQATFLLLARNAAAIRKGEAVGPWLHRVAWRLAVKTRAQAACRLAHERRAGSMRQAQAGVQTAWQELQETLDAALHQLPARYRAALVLCYLEGKSHEQAARELGCPVGTLGSWLARGRRLLRGRLARRGLTLSAGALATALAADAVIAQAPAALAGPTVRAALRLATGEPAAAVVRPTVLKLIQEGLPTMVLKKLKLAMVLVLTVGLLALGAGLWAHLARADRQGQGTGKKATNSSPRAEDGGKDNERQPPAPAKQMTVTGQVVDAGGKAVTGAHVAVIGRDISPHRAYERETLNVILGQGLADAHGRFRLRVPRTSSRRYWQVYVQAAAPGHGLNKVDFQPDARQPDVTVALAREQVVRGRLVDLQGAPAPKVQVHVISVMGDWVKDRLFVEFRDPPKGLAVWPLPVTTDDLGRYCLRGLPAGRTFILQVGDHRFARQTLIIQAEDKAKEANFSLAAAFLIEGTVTLADTGQPVPRARLWVMPAKQQPYELDWRAWMEARADAQGHFRVSTPVGNYFHIMAYPPEGTPYLLVRKLIKRSRANVKQKITMALPRGVLVRGKIVEQASGQPVAGASVVFMPHGDNNPFYREDTRPLLQERGQNAVSGSRGEFAIPVLPGWGHLVVCGPTPDYVRIEVSYQALHGLSTGPGSRQYPDGLAALNLKPQQGPHEVTVRLRRGVTRKGQALGTDGKPVAQAVLVSRACLPHGLTLSGKTTAILKGGRFELHGCDPEKPVQAFILDATHQWGAVAELSGKQAGRRATVKLRPCGQAKLRLVDKAGKPVADFQVHVELIITPGCHPTDVEGKRKREPEADACYMSNLDPKGHAEARLRSDRQGRITLPTLIPGATFRLSGTWPDRRLFSFNKQFQVEAGQTLGLGDLLVPQRP